MFGIRYVSLCSLYPFYSLSSRLINQWCTRQYLSKAILSTALNNYRTSWCCFQEAPPCNRFFVEDLGNTWDDIEISAGRTLELGQSEVCICMYGLHDDQCPGLSTILCSLLSPFTCSASTIVQTPRWPQSPSSLQPPVTSQGASPMPAGQSILSIPSMKMI